MPPHALIDDPRVLAMPLDEVGEPLVWPSIGTWDHPRVRNRAPSRFLVRAGVARRLEAADAALTGGSIVLAEGHRPVDVQQRFWDHRYDAVRAAKPEWSDAACRAETAKFVAPPDGAPPHSTGAAVDVIVVGSDGSAVDMGSVLNEAGPLMATGAGVPPAARRWRDRLVAAMEGAGFVNYPTSGGTSPTATGTGPGVPGRALLSTAPWRRPPTTALLRPSTTTAPWRPPTTTAQFGNPASSGHAQFGR